MKQHIFYGWQLSYFSGKLRGYLRHKRIPFDDRAVNALTLMWRIPKHTGATVMPVVVTPQGEWLQDTTHIIEVLDQRFPERPALPETPRRRLAALLIEAWADEFWIPPAMHYRWSYPGNYSLFEHDAGAALIPFAPAMLRKAMARKVASQLRAYLPAVGVTPEQAGLLERWTIAQLDALEIHFSRHRWLLGNGPCLADFALNGPLYAHLGRDPVPLQRLIEPRPHLHAWILRVQAGEQGEPDDGSDDIPDTLQPLLGSVINEFLPMVDAIRNATSNAGKERTPGSHLPRSLGRIECPMLDARFSRHAMPYTLWMLQRIQQLLGDWPSTARAAALDWFANQGAGNLLEHDLGPELERAGLHVKLATETAVPQVQR